MPADAVAGGVAAPGPGTRPADRPPGPEGRRGDTAPAARAGLVVAPPPASAQGDVPPRDQRLYDELEGLARYIERAKAEISAIRCDDIRSHHLPTAAFELDAIGAHLERATGVILDASEEIEGIGAELGPSAGTRVTEVVTRIYEACSFQDIAGQRITKIIQVLQTIEARVVGLLEFLGPGFPVTGEGGAAPVPAAGAERAGLINGPQLPGLGNSQHDVDAILSEAR